MAATGLMIEHSLARHHAQPGIYEKAWTGDNDKRNEVGGFIATALRVLCPPWRNGPREGYVVGRYWVAGHARREAGVLFVARMRDLSRHMAVLREAGAVEIKVERTIKPAPTVEELTINPQREEQTPGTVSSIDPPGSAGEIGDELPWRVDHPPDG